MKPLLLIGLLLGLAAPAQAQYSFGKGSCVLRDGRQITGSMRLNFPTAQASSVLRYYDGKQEEEFTPTSCATAPWASMCLLWPEILWPPMTTAEFRSTRTLWKWWIP